MLSPYNASELVDVNTAHKNGVKNDITYIINNMNTIDRKIVKELYKPESINIEQWMSTTFNARIVKIDKNTSYIESTNLSIIPRMLANSHDFLISEFTKDTLYSYKDNHLTPLAIRHPSVQSQKTPIVISPHYYTDNYLFFKPVELRADKDYAFAPYIVKARMQLMRDFGCYPAANSSFLLNLGLETLAVRMQRYCENALKVAQYIESTGKTEFITYPALPTSKGHELAKKYLPLGTSGVISFSIKGGRSVAVKFMDSLKLASNEVHVADIRTCVLHPASATHRQLTDEQLVAAGIDGGLIRFSVGLENVDDIIADLEQAFAKI